MIWLHCFHEIRIGSLGPKCKLNQFFFFFWSLELLPHNVFQVPGWKHQLGMTLDKVSVSRCAGKDGRERDKLPKPRSFLFLCLILYRWWKFTMDYKCLSANEIWMSVVDAPCERLVLNCGFLCQTSLGISLGPGCEVAASTRRWGPWALVLFLSFLPQAGCSPWALISGPDLAKLNGEQGGLTSWRGINTPWKVWSMSAAQGLECKL